PAHRHHAPFPTRRSPDLAERRAQRARSTGRPVLFQLADSRWVELRERRTKDGGIVSIRRDVTEAKRREAEIERQRALLAEQTGLDRKSTRLNSSHDQISY